MRRSRSSRGGAKVSDGTAPMDRAAGDGAALHRARDLQAAGEDSP